MKTQVTRMIPIAVAVCLALALLALGFPASASPDAPNPGHAWTEVENHGISGGNYWLGTTTDNALDVRVNNYRALRLEPDATSPNIIGGYGGNEVTDGVIGATIGGGGRPLQYPVGPNRVMDDYGTVGGGHSNGAGDGDATTDDAGLATVGGGYFNWASAGGATVGGGALNEASGSNATVPGGMLNTAAGDYSFAAGYRAKADHDGSFVWGDSTAADIESTASDQFLVRASGGALFRDGDGNAVLLDGKVICLNYLGPDGSSALYFYGSSGNPYQHWLAWYEPFDRFEFSTDLHVYGTLTATTKSAVVDTSQGPRLTYTVESPEMWLEDFGTGQLEGGKAVVSLDPLFAETVNTDIDYHVFLTPLGESEGLYVAEKTATSFEVREAGGSDISFDYRIVAKRRGYEDERLAEFTGAAEGEAAGSAPPAETAAEGAAGESGGSVSLLVIVLPLAAVAAALVAGLVLVQRRVAGARR